MCLLYYKAQDLGSSRFTCTGFVKSKIGNRFTQVVQSALMCTFAIN